MRSIVIASNQPTEDDPVVSFAADLAARTGATTRLVVTERASPEHILEHACAADVDLVVLSPRVSPASMDLEADPTASRLLFRCGPAVLVVRPPLRKIRKILVPVRREDLRRGTLAPALQWAERFRRAGERTDGGPGPEPVEIQVLHMAQDPDEMYEDLPQLRDQFDRLSASSAASKSLRRLACVRWGAPVPRRIAGWVALHDIDLVILGRPAPPPPSGSPDQTWFHAISLAGCLTLLLQLDNGSRDDEPRMSAGRFSRG